MARGCPSPPGIPHVASFHHQLPAAVCSPSQSLLPVNYKYLFTDFPGGLDGKSLYLQCRRPGSIPGSGRSSGEGNGNPLQYSCLENPMDRGRSLAGYSPWGHKESDTTETSFHLRLTLWHRPHLHDPTWSQGSSLVSSTLLGLVLHR